MKSCRYAFRDPQQHERFEQQPEHQTRAHRPRRTYRTDGSGERLDRIDGDRRELFGTFQPLLPAFSTDQFAQRLVRAMRTDLERGDRNAGAAGRGLKGHAVEFEQREGFALRGRKSGQQRLDIGQGRWRSASARSGKSAVSLFPAAARAQRRREWSAATLRAIA